MSAIFGELFAPLVEDIRRSPEYLAPCPLCSHMGVHGFPDQIVTPMLCGRDGDACRIVRCCSLSETSLRFESRAAAAQWWREARLVLHPWLALANRQASTLDKLRAANLDAL